MKSEKRKAFNPNDYVVHCKKAKCDVIIGRTSKWGNPFVIDKIDKKTGNIIKNDGTREEVITKYHEWLLKPEEAQLLNDARVIAR